MKKSGKYLIILYFFLFLFPLFSSGQIVLGKYVISSGAGICENEMYSSKNSIGQPLLGIFQNQNYNITSGFWNDGGFLTKAKKIPLAVYADSVVIYPNPTWKFLHVNIPGKGILEIIDGRGIVLLNEIYLGQQTFDLTNYKSGIYLLRFRNKTHLLTEKIVKQ